MDVENSSQKLSWASEGNLLHFPRHSHNSAATQASQNQEGQK